MGQRFTTIKLGQQINLDRYVMIAELDLSIFLTDFGWFGLLGRQEKISRLVIGHTSSDSVRETIARQMGLNVERESSSMNESDWLPDVRRRLEQYAAGQSVDFRDCKLGNHNHQPTPFQQRVLKLTRKIPYGATLTYGKLAEKADAPRAARAVGSVMASNRVPIIIPCHRVIAAGSKLGGFSAPNGVRLKEQMLAMEAAAGHDSGAS